MKFSVVYQCRAIEHFLHTYGAEERDGKEAAEPAEGEACGASTRYVGGNREGQRVASLEDMVSELRVHGFVTISHSTVNRLLNRIGGKFGCCLVQQNDSNTYRCHLNSRMNAAASRIKSVKEHGFQNVLTQAREYIGCSFRLRLVNIDNQKCRLHLENQIHRHQLVPNLEKGGETSHSLTRKIRSYSYMSLPLSHKIRELIGLMGEIPGLTPTELTDSIITWNAEYYIGVSSSQGEIFSNHIERLWRHIRQSRHSAMSCWGLERYVPTLEEVRNYSRTRLFGKTFRESPLLKQTA